MLARSTYFDTAAAPAPHERALLRVLLAQDGSTPRLCEAIAGQPLALHVLRQAITQDVPELVRAQLRSASFMERFSSLAARGQVMMDNLAYIALDRLTPELRSGLESGAVPIGHLLESHWVRRKALAAEVAGPLRTHLWSVVGMPDAGATRAYTIATAEGPLFLIVETYRRGMRMEPPAGADAAAPEPG